MTVLEIRAGAVAHFVSGTCARWARGAASPMLQRWAYVIRLRDGLVAEMTAHLDLEEARQEAGVG